jgi:WXXGXW repeat (2 copies)
MTIKTAMLCAALGVASIVPLTSQARVYLDVNVAPPAPQEEVIPAARVGYVWAPGYWNYDGHHHVWAKGHWERERHGHHWVADSWQERNGGWHRERGHWD